MPFRDAFQELRELGVRGTLFRIQWELRARTGLLARFAAPEPKTEGLELLPVRLFANPFELRQRFASVIGDDSLRRLRQAAFDATKGRVVCFSTWQEDFGDPIDWYRSPVDGVVWSNSAEASRALEAMSGEVKYIWEIGRFTHVYPIVRAATYFPEDAPTLAAGLWKQMTDFDASASYSRGIQWASGLEVAIRMMSWLFATDAFCTMGIWGDEQRRFVARQLVRAATHIEEYFSYVVEAVFNDHLIGEALALWMAGVLVPASPRAKTWKALEKST